MLIDAVLWLHWGLQAKSDGGADPDGGACSDGAESDDVYDC